MKLTSAGPLALIGAVLTVTALALAGCSASEVSAVTTTSPVPSPSESRPVPTATASPTPFTTFVDPASLSIDPSLASSNGDALENASFDVLDGHGHCGIYPDFDFQSGDARLSFGCRLEDGFTFTYPGADYPPIGGCPSGFSVTDTNPAEVLCNSGLVFLSEMGTAKTLAVGTGVRLAGVECVSRADGVRCVNTASGHGFRLSLSSYDLF